MPKEYSYPKNGSVICKSDENNINNNKLYNQNLFVIDPDNNKVYEYLNQEQINSFVNSCD